MGCGGTAPRGVRDRPATGHRTRRHGPAPDIGCSWVLIRTCRIAPDLMRHFVANYDTFRKSTRRNRDVQMATAERPRVHRDECNSLRSEEPPSELQSLMRISYAVFCLKKKNKKYEYMQI